MNCSPQEPAAGSLSLLKTPRIPLAYQFRPLSLTILFAIVLGATLTADAADRYVRAGALGRGDGSDWANAYTALPATLTRGDTYYVAAGQYPSYRFDDPESGSQVITIKKATNSDHGTQIGWQPSYANGQAVFASVLRFERGYYVFDGQTRNEGNWFDGPAYGFKVAHNNQNQNIVIGVSGRASNNVTIRHTYVDAIVGSLPNTTIRRYAIDTDTYGGPVNTGLVFHRMFVNGSNNVWFLRTTNGAIVEYSASANAASNGANHGEIVNLYYSGNNAILRYNIFREAFIGNPGTALVAITQAHGLHYYGNVAYDFQVTDGAIGFLGGNTSNCRIYNNTFVRGIGYNSGFASDGSNNITYNNLWVGNTAAVNISGTHDYNAFSDSSARGEANAQTNVQTSIFANYQARDLTLAQPTSAGVALATPFHLDPGGSVRGMDGRWDRGAYEYADGISSTPSAPANLRVE